MPPHLVTRIIEKYMEDGNAMSQPLLKLIAGEQWPVTSLTISNRQDIDTTWFKLIIAASKHLRHLIFVDCKFFNALSLESISQLQSLSIESCTDIGGKTLSELCGANGLPSLKRLSLSRFDYLGGKLGRVNMPKLEHLLLHETVPSIDLLKAVGGSLKILEINGSSLGDLTSNTFEIFYQIERIILSRVTCMTAFLLNLKNWFPALKHLRIDRSRIITALGSGSVTKLVAPLFAKNGIELVMDRVY